jgi:hypothetical protein
MMSFLPSLDFLLVTFSTGIRTEGLRRIGRKLGLRNEAEGYQQAPEQIPQ